MNFKNMVVFANELSGLKECSIWSRVKPVVKFLIFCTHTTFEDRTTKCKGTIHLGHPQFGEGRGQMYLNVANSE